MEGDATFDEDDSFDEIFIDGRVTLEDFLPDSDKENDVYSASHLGRSEVVQERELADPIPSTSKVVSIEKETDFRIITQGTEKKRDIVVSNVGHIFTKSKSTKTATYWQCSHRYSKKRARCSATVILNGHNEFKKGRRHHNHEVDNFNRARRELYRNAKQAGHSDLFRPARDIVETMLDKNEIVHSPAIPNPLNVAKAVNRNRATDRPAEPTELVFDVDESCQDGFLRDDIKIDGARHLVFATTSQLDMLRDAKRWYLDGTFFVVKPPFYQLFSIHAFNKNGDNTKQIPLVFAIMSGKRSDDYIAVLKSIHSLLLFLSLEECVTDYEPAIWIAVRKVLSFVYKEKIH